MRELHARRVAGSRGMRGGRLSDRVVSVRRIHTTGRSHFHRPRHAQHSARAGAGAYRDAEQGRNPAEHSRSHPGPGGSEPDDRDGGEGRALRARRPRHHLQGRPEGSEPILLREWLLRRPADHSADSRGRGVVPAPYRPPARRDAGRTAARQSRGDRMEHRGQRRDGRLPAGIHADPGRAGRGDVRSALWRRAQRQHAGRRHADHPQRPDHQSARLQLHAGRPSRRISAEHLDRPLLAPVPAQRGGLSAAQDRQGDLRQYLARRAGGKRGCAEGNRLGAEQRRNGFRRR